MKRDIAELECGKMLVHPQSPHLVPTLESKVPALKQIAAEFTPKVFTKAMVYRYVLLMYDKGSPVRNMMSLDWFEQKFEACAYAGFELTAGRDGYKRFDQKVVDMILGKNNDVNDIIISYLGYQSDERWGYTVFLKESMLSFTRDALGRKITDYKSAADYKKLYDDYMRITSEMSREKDETQEFVNRFYYNIEQARLAIRPENYADIAPIQDNFRGDNPYGMNYTVDTPRFLGDDESKLTV